MNPVNRFMAKMSFRGQTKVRIIRKLQRMILAEIPLTKALDQLHHSASKHGKKPSEPLAMMINEWRSRLRSGKSLAVALTGWVTLSEQMIIEAGEQTDQLAKALEDSLNANGASSKIRNTIIGGLAYPLVLFAILGFMLWGFATSLAPTFADIIPIEQWSGKAATTYAVADFVATKAIWILAGLGIIGAMVWFSLPRLTGSVRTYLDYIPPYSIYKISQGASFMVSMRGFITAGVAIPAALRKIQANSDPYLRDRAGAILARVAMGRNLGDAMREAGHNFPDPGIADEVSIYADLDNFDRNLDLLANEWIEGSIDRSRVAAKTMGNVLLILVAVSIGFIALSMFDLQSQMSAMAEQQ